MGLFKKNKTVLEYEQKMDAIQDRKMPIPEHYYNLKINVNQLDFLEKEFRDFIIKNNPDYTYGQLYELVDIIERSIRKQLRKQTT